MGSPYTHACMTANADAYCRIPIRWLNALHTQPPPHRGHIALYTRSCHECSRVHFPHHKMCWSFIIAFLLWAECTEWWNLSSNSRDWCTCVHVCYTCTHMASIICNPPSPHALAGAKPTAWYVHTHLHTNTTISSTRVHIMRQRKFILKNELRRGLTENSFDVSIFLFGHLNY